MGGEGEAEGGSWELGLRRGLQHRLLTFDVAPSSVQCLRSTSASISSPPPRRGVAAADTQLTTLARTVPHALQYRGGTGPNGIDIEVSRHHTVSVSNFQCIEVSTDDGMVHF